MVKHQITSLKGIWRWGRLALPLAVLAVMAIALVRTGEADTTASIELSIGIPGVCDTLSGNAKCDLAAASFTLDLDVDDVQSVPELASGYDGVQMVIFWEGAVEGPKPDNANTITNTSTDPGCALRFAQMEPGQRVDHATVACIQFSTLLLTMGTSGFENANLGQAEFDCVSPGVGTITLLHGAATNASFATDYSLLSYAEKNPSDVLTINCGPTPTPTPTSTPAPTPATVSVGSNPQSARGFFGSIAIPTGPFNANVAFSRQLANDSYTLLVTEIGGVACDVLAKSASGFSVACVGPGSLEWAVLEPTRLPPGR